MQYVWKVILNQSSNKSLSKIPEPWNGKIIKALHYLQDKPFIGKKLSGQLNNKRKLKIWPYRIIYSTYLKSKTILIEEIAHRQGVYK